MESLATNVILDLYCVHFAASEAVESLVTLWTLHSCAFSLATIAIELLVVHEFRESLADSHPFFLLNTEVGVLVDLDAVVVEEQRTAHNLLFVIILAEWTDERLVFLLTKGAHPLRILKRRCIQVLFKVVVLVWLSSGWVSRRH